MEHFIIESKFRQRVLASGIVRVSAGLKNISGSAQRRGFAAELSVIRLLQTKNWTLGFHGLKTKIAEIDLVFEKENQILLVEVKTLNSSWRAFERIQKKQLIKLKQNHILFYQLFMQMEIRAYVAWVDAENKITFVDVS